MPYNSIGVAYTVSTRLKFKLYDSFCIIVSFFMIMQKR